MKKILTTLLTLIVCCTAALCLSACGETGRGTITATGTISIQNYDDWKKTTTNDDKTEVGHKSTALSSITITYTDEDGAAKTWNSWEEASKDGVMFSGWDPHTVGTRKLVITYRGTSVEIDYTIS